MDGKQQHQAGAGTAPSTGYFPQSVLQSQIGAHVGDILPSFGQEGEGNQVAADGELPGDAVHERRTNLIQRLRSGQAVLEGLAAKNICA